MAQCFYSTPTLYLGIIVASGFVGHFLVVGGLHLAGLSSHLSIKRKTRIPALIGILERMIVTTLALSGSIGATVFIFAAKTAVLTLRLPSEVGKTRRETVEYMLIGTMLSYLIALAFSFSPVLMRWIFR